MSQAELARTIDDAFERRAEIGVATKGPAREAVEAAIELLDRGEARVAERTANGAWRVNQWLKKALLLSFPLNDMAVIPGGPGRASWWDKVTSKFDGWDATRFRAAGFRAVPGAIVREGAVLAMGVFIGASTRIVDRESGEVFRGEVPAYAVVVPGSMPGKPMRDGSSGPALNCAVIVKRVDEKTRTKTSINELLRD